MDWIHNDIDHTCYNYVSKLKKFFKVRFIKTYHRSTMSDVPKKEHNVQMIIICPNLRGREKNVNFHYITSNWFEPQLHGGEWKDKLSDRKREPKKKTWHNERKSHFGVYMANNHVLARSTCSSPNESCYVSKPSLCLPRRRLCTWRLASFSWSPDRLHATSIPHTSMMTLGQLRSPWRMYVVAQGYGKPG